jgi:hypothetical protein
MEYLDYNNVDFKSKLKYSRLSPTGIVVIDTNKSVGSRERDRFGNAKAIRFKFKGKRFLVHRIVWVLNFGSIPSDLQIDHIDGNPFNNTIENLRLVTPSLNQRNRSKNVNNKTGEHGVAFHRTSNNSGGHNDYVRVVWVDISAKQRHADFNLKRFNSVDDAVEFAALYRELVLSGDNTYSESHGIRESKRKYLKGNE